MEIKKIRHKQLCPHKLAKLSKDKNRSDRRATSHQHQRSQHDHRRSLIKDLQTQNQKLKAENYIFQEYFATFEVKYKEQKRENHRLKRRVEELSRERDGGSSQRKTESTYIMSERTIGRKTSRATKESRRTIGNEYI